MKAITPIIGIIILLLITITLVGSAYTFLFGIAESAASKTIKIAPGSINDNTVIVQNLGTEIIQPNEIRIEISGSPVEIVNPVSIPPRQNALIEFKSPIAGDNINVRVIGPTNPVSYLSNIRTVTIPPYRISLAGATWCFPTPFDGQLFLAGTDNDGFTDYGGIFNWTLLDGPIPTTATIKSTNLSIYLIATSGNCHLMNTSYFYQVDNMSDCSNFNSVPQGGVEDPVNGSGPADAKAQINPPFTDCVSDAGNKTFLISGAEADNLIRKGGSSIYFDMHGEDSINLLSWAGNNTNITRTPGLEITYKLPS